MNIKNSFSFKGSKYHGVYMEPSSCPICKHAIKPVVLHNSTYENADNQWFLSFLYLCQHCYETFLSLHSVSLKPAREYGQENTFAAKLLHIAPTRHKKRDFDEKISDMSPQFVKIYNQSLAAEGNDLDEIAGIGYRKSVEFLVKDFCIKQYPESEEKIKNLLLSKCISEFINDQDIKTLASRIAWIGNDEAHYTRKLEGRDVSDMKSFIDAMVYFVSKVLTVEDALSISPARSTRPDSKENDK